MELGTPCCYNPVGQGALMTRELLRCPNSHLAAPAKGPLQLPCPTLLVAKAMMAAGGSAPTQPPLSHSTTTQAARLCPSTYVPAKPTEMPTKCQRINPHPLH